MLEVASKPSMIGMLQSMKMRPYENVPLLYAAITLSTAS
jgi:hypothetical protein